MGEGGGANRGGFMGPDGSNQWLSMGELGAGADLDEALAELGGRTIILRLQVHGERVEGISVNPCFVDLDKGNSVPDEFLNGAVPVEP